MSKQSRKAGMTRIWRIALSIEFAWVYEGLTSDKNLDRWRKRIIRRVDLDWDKPRLPKYWATCDEERVGLVARKLVRSPAPMVIIYKDV